MKYLTPIEIGMKALVPERGNLSAWVNPYPDKSILSECANCEHSVLTVSPYCPNCGSLMLNYPEISKRRITEQEEKNDDIS